MGNNGASRILLLGRKKTVWTPDQIANLSRWYDANTISTLYQDSGKTIPVTANGNPVGAWVGREGYGPDLLQATTANKPTYTKNGLPAIYFVTDDFLSGAIDNQVTYFFAVKNYVGGCLAGDSIATRSIRRNSATSARWVADVIDTTPTDPAGTKIWCCYQTATDKIVRFNGSQAGTLASVATRNWDNIGMDSGGNYLNGYLFEVLMYSTLLTIDNIVLVENYLNSKWGIY